MSDKTLPPLFVDRATTQRVLDCNKNEYWRLVRVGELEAVRDMPGRSRVTYASVLRYAEKLRQRSASQPSSDRAARMRAAKSTKATGDVA